jgi:branched-chain amino acid transport system substrate-binding protein
VYEGAQSWIDKVNKAGGVNGRKITWDAMDDAGDVQRAAANAKKLIEDEKVLAIFNTCGSADTAAIVPEVDSQNVPLLFPNALSLALLKPPHDTIYTVIPLAGQQIAAGLQYLLKTQGPGTIGVVYIGGIDANLMPAVNQLASQNNSKVVADIAVKSNQTDWGPAVIQLQQSNPDYLLVASSTPGSGQLLAQMGRQGYKPKKATLGYQAMADITYVQTAGAPADGTYAITPVVAASDDRAKACNATLKSTTMPSMYTLIGCTHAQLIVKALKDAGQTLNRDTLLKAVRAFKNVDVGTAPLVSNDPSHLMINTVEVVRVKSGDFVSASKTPLPIPAV